MVCGVGQVHVSWRLSATVGADTGVWQVRAFLESSKATSYNSQTSNFPESTFGKMFTFFDHFIDQLNAHQKHSIELLKREAPPT